MLKNRLIIKIRPVTRAAKTKAANPTNKKVFIFRFINFQ
jgi:hypothetical protein